MHPPQPPQVRSNSIWVGECLLCKPKMAKTVIWRVGKWALSPQSKLTLVDKRTKRAWVHQIKTLIERITKDLLLWLLHSNTSRNSYLPFSRVIRRQWTRQRAVYLPISLWRRSSLTCPTRPQRPLQIKLAKTRMEICRRIWTCTIMVRPTTSR